MSPGSASTIAIQTGLVKRTERITNEDLVRPVIVGDPAEDEARRGLRNVTEVIARRRANLYCQIAQELKTLPPRAGHRVLQPNTS